MKCVKCHKREGTINLPLSMSIHSEGDGMVCPKCYAWIDSWDYKLDRMIEQERDPEQDDIELDSTYIDECGGYHVIR